MATRDADNLTAKQHKALSALLTEPTIKAAAEKVGIGERTLHAWLKEDAAFAEAYRAARRDAVGQAIARLQQASAAAVAVLCQLMADRTKPASVRLAAASKVLDLSIRAVELEDITQRLEALEHAYASKV